MKYLAILALLPVVAFATDKQPQDFQQQTQFQSQNQGQEQTQGQTQSANNNGVSQQSNTYFSDRLQAPASFSPSIAPTAPCYYSASGGLSIPGGSIGGGKAFLDAACQKREEIRLAYQMGLVAEADYLFCSTIGKDIPNCGVRPPAAPAPEQKPLVVVLQGDGCARDEKLKRVLDACVSK